MNPTTKRTAAAAILAGLAMAGTQAVATAQAKDPENRMDLGEFYTIRAGDYQAGVEAECGCTADWLDRWTTVDGVTHKRVAYADAADHQFRVDYFREDGVWVLESKSIQADGLVFAFKSDRG